MACICKDTTLQAQITMLYDNPLLVELTPDRLRKLLKFVHSVTIIGNIFLTHDKNNWERNKAWTLCVFLRFDGVSVELKILFRSTT